MGKINYPAGQGGKGEEVKLGIHVGDGQFNPKTGCQPCHESITNRAPCPAAPAPTPRKSSWDQCELHSVSGLKLTPGPLHELALLASKCNL